jgi:hypothetical protein
MQPVILAVGCAAILRQATKTRGGSLARKSVYFGTEALDKARLRLGLTNQDVWEELGIGETTWMRWKRDGSIPIERLTDAVLLLELPKPKNMDGETPLTAWKMLTAGKQATDEMELLKRKMQRLESRLRKLEKG